MNILLIHPNKFAHRYLSVGLSMISAVLKQNGHNVLFFDTSRFQDLDSKTRANYSEKSIQKMSQSLQFLPVELPAIERSDVPVFEALDSRIKKFEPNLIAFSATSSEFSYAVKIVNNIKKHKIPIIVGGAHATVAPIEALSVDGVDMVVSGEGEEAIIELMDMMQSGKFRTDIENIYFKANGKIISNKIRPYIRDLDRLPFLDIDIFDKFHHLGAYSGKEAVYCRVETGRGCPYKCSYCVNATLHDTVYRHEKTHVRHKSPKRVVDELVFIKNKINFDIVRFVDETFTAATVEWLREFSDYYTSQINKPMIIATRPERVTRAKMELLRRCNDTIQVTMGIESGSERIRKDILNRPMSNKKIIEAYHLCHELGFSTASFNMIGVPGETRKDFFETIRLNVESKVQTPMLSYFYPFVGCKLRSICLKEGYVDDGLHEVDYSVSSVLKLPGFPLSEIEGLKRTFVMYVKMDKSFYPEIEKAERDDAVFNKLVAIYNEQALSKKTA